MLPLVCPTRVYWVTTFGVLRELAGQSMQRLLLLYALQCNVFQSSPSRVPKTDMLVVGVASKITVHSTTSVGVSEKQSDLMVYLEEYAAPFKVQLMTRQEKEKKEKKSQKMPTPLGSSI